MSTICLPSEPDNRRGNIIGSKLSQHLCTERSPNFRMAIAAFLGIRMGPCVGWTKGHEKRNAVRCPGHPSKDRSRHGESLLRVNAKSRPDPSTKLAQASVNECRHLPGMFDAHIENDGITCPYAQALLRHALYQAIEMRSWSNLQCRWASFRPDPAGRTRSCRL